MCLILEFQDSHIQPPMKTGFYLQLFLKSVCLLLELNFPVSDNNLWIIATILAISLSNFISSLVCLQVLHSFKFIVVKSTWHKMYHINHLKFRSHKYIHSVMQRVSGTFLYRKTETLYPINNFSFLPPLSPWPQPFCSVSMNLVTLGTSCKWNCIVFFFVCLAYFA